MLKLDSFLSSLDLKSSTEWFSSIHLRITLNGKKTDFWPTTGSWHSLTTGHRGKGVDGLKEFLRTNPAPIKRERPVRMIQETFQFSFLDDSLDIPHDPVDNNPELPPW